MVERRRRYVKKYCKYCKNKVTYIDYKSIDQFRHALSERFKIMPRRLTGTCKKHQDMLKIAIKRARQSAIVPYIVDKKKVGETPMTYSF